MSDYKLQQAQIKKLEQEVNYFIQKADQTKSSAVYDRAKQLKEKIQRIKDYGVKKPKKPKKINIMLCGLRGVLLHCIRLHVFCTFWRLE